MELWTPSSSISQPIRAVEYLRMSTEAQQYSILHQQSTIRHYAAAHGMEVIRTYADEGRSGLTLHRREALVRLLNDVQAGNADFDVILVYDVSRWGRFQDVDESAHYEFLCRMRNVRVHYCAEPFANQSGPLVDILKAIKRTMAAEYSRELAIKIAFAHRQGALAGHYQGGPAVYGLRRMLVGQDGRHIQILERGSHKGIKDYRTTLVPGPSHEVATIRWIFHMYTEERLNGRVIAERLTADGVEYVDNRPWTPTLVRTVLRNERYLGVLVYNRSSSDLINGGRTNRRTRNHPSQWIRTPAGFAALITNETFERAKHFRSMYGKSYLDDQALLDHLKDLWAKHGKLNTTVIDQASGMPTAPVYVRHFGSLRRAYGLIGYVSEKDWCGYPDGLFRLTLAKQIIGTVIQEAADRGATTRWNGQKRQVTINGNYTVAAVVARNTKRYRWHQWRIFTRRENIADITIIARLDIANAVPMDFLCVPAAVAGLLMNKTFRDDPARFDSYKVGTLEDATRTVVACALQCAAEPSGAPAC
jgi:DNA invertase Pin-like site-specific DNA recombinase